MHELHYKGATIQALPRHTDVGWLAAGKICHYLSRLLVERPLALANSRPFATEAEACTYAFAGSKQQLDRGL
jgi:hypothetical protein